jgi:hypothetical protein
MTTLTSAGAVNLTTSTNWSPAQIPQAGDDLVIGAHTLTLDADLTLNTITFSSTSSRMAISGTTRSVQATNGFEITAAPSAVLISTTLTAGISVTLTGKWFGNGLTHNFGNGMAASTGGNLTLRTVGADPSTVLIGNLSSANASSRVLISSWSGGTFTTIGRIDGSNWNGSFTFVTMSGGTWNHTNTGTSYVGSSGQIVLASCSGTASFNWTGNLIAAVNGTGAFINITGSGNHSISEMIKRTVAGPNVTINGGTLAPVIAYASTGTLTITGQVCSLKTARTIAIDARASSPGRINWRSQSVSIASTDAVIILNTLVSIIDMTALVISNAGVFTYVECGSASAVVDAQTVITNTTTSAQASVTSASTALDGKVINLASNAPTLPTVSQVAGGVSYGYAASLLTGTGIINDPATIAAAVGTALESISVQALRRFVTIDTGETEASNGSVVKLAQGGAIDLSPVLTRLPDALEDGRIAASIIGNGTLANQELIIDKIDAITGEQLAAITVESGTIGNFPEVLTIGDSYDTDTGWIKISITNESGDPIDSLGSLLFEDATVSFTAFRPNDSATISGSCEFVDSGSETYVKLTFTSVETNKGLPEYTYEGRLKFVWTGGKQKTYKTTPFKFIANP